MNFRNTRFALAASAVMALIALVVGLGAQVVGTQLSTIFSEIGSYVGSVTVPTA